MPVVGSPEALLAIEAALRAYLLEDVALAALIGTRIYPVVMPQKPDLPAVTYLRVTGSRVHSNDGPSGLSSPRFQFDCWALTYLGARAVAEALRLRLDGFKGLIGGSPARHDIQGVFFETEREFYESETKLYRHSGDYFIHYRESV